MPKGKYKYADLEGRQYNSLVKLAKDNGVRYNELYYLYHSKKLPLREALQPLLEKERRRLVLEKEREKDKVFSPETRFPGREYVRWLHFRIHQQLEEAETLKGVKAYNTVKETEKLLQNKVNSLDMFWLDAIDSYVCRGADSLKRLDICTAKQVKAMADHPAGIFRDIYEVFAKEWNLGKYAV